METLFNIALLAGCFYLARQASENERKLNDVKRLARYQESLIRHHRRCDPSYAGPNEEPESLQHDLADIGLLRLKHSDTRVPPEDT